MEAALDADLHRIASDESEPFDVRVKNMRGGTITMSVRPTDPLSVVCDGIFDREDFPVDSYALNCPRYRKSRGDDGSQCTIAQCGIVAGSVITMSSGGLMPG